MPKWTLQSLLYIKLVTILHRSIVYVYVCVHIYIYTQYIYTTYVCVYIYKLMYVYIYLYTHIHDLFVVYHMGKRGANICI